MTAVSNSTGEYLKLHIEAETEGSKIQTPPFEEYWLRFLHHLKQNGGDVRESLLEHEKACARSWFELGAMAERLR